MAKFLQDTSEVLMELHLMNLILLLVSVSSLLRREDHAIKLGPLVLHLRLIDEQWAALSEVGSGACLDQRLHAEALFAL